MKQEDEFVLLFVSILHPIYGTNMCIDVGNLVYHRASEQEGFQIPLGDMQNELLFDAPSLLELYLLRVQLHVHGKTDDWQY